MERNPANIEGIKFGCRVFNDAVMRDKLPSDTYRLLKKTVDEGIKLDPSVANIVASAMKSWAIENGATHFCHWFMPMTSTTSEKHDAFLSPDKANNGGAIMRFSGKNLIKGEPDASSFPSGGLRATFEARGYTAWDCTSPAFIKDGSLYIPTAFCSYNGDALDKKTPLLRSMEALSAAAAKTMRLLGYTGVRRVISMSGAEQEYFLVDKKFYEKRLDLMLTGRTLIGRLPPKGQEMEDHYFGSLKQRVSDYMKDLDGELWQFGIFSKTKHNETAPAQHELAPVYCITNIATDHNYLTMEIMKKVAARHNLVCLLHEKPFKGINGSGKHNNWSLSTDTGINLLEPGKEPRKNLVFLVTLAAVMSGVDKYGDLLRMSAASAGNDLRLGALEAPPAIVSMYLGSDLYALVQEIITGKAAESCVHYHSSKVNTLPDFATDNSDRNRTSPFAFTGNKFEFRMVGSNASIAGPNTIINAIAADAFNMINERLEGRSSRKAEAEAVIKELFAGHERILFNGNNYAAEWVIEAERRGLPNLKNTPDAIGVLKLKKNVDMLVRAGVYSASELESRHEILMENYVKTVNIEALTMLDMLRREILPAAASCAAAYADCAAKTKGIGGVNFANEIAGKIMRAGEELYARIYALEEAVNNCRKESIADTACACRDSVLPLMAAAREIADNLEGLMDSAGYPLPTYTDLLYRV